MKPSLIWLSTIFTQPVSLADVNFWHTLSCITHTQTHTKPLSHTNRPRCDIDFCTHLFARHDNGELEPVEQADQQLGWQDSASDRRTKFRFPLHRIWVRLVQEKVEAQTKMAGLPDSIEGRRWAKVETGVERMWMPGHCKTPAAIQLRFYSGPAGVLLALWSRKSLTQRREDLKEEQLENRWKHRRVCAVATRRVRKSSETTRTFKELSDCQSGSCERGK